MASASLPTSASTTSERIVTGRIWRAGLFAALTAVVGNVIIYAVARGPLGIPQEFQVLQMIAPTIIFTLIGVLSATGVFALIARTARRPISTFRIVALIALAVTIIPDLLLVPTMPGSSGMAIVALILMHIVAAAASIGFLTTFTRADH